MVCCRWRGLLRSLFGSGGRGAGAVLFAQAYFAEEIDGLPISPRSSSAFISLVMALGAEGGGWLTQGPGGGRATHCCHFPHCSHAIMTFPSSFTTS